MSKQKQKGTAFETAVVDYINARLGEDTVRREVLHGARDIGDITGLSIGGVPLVIEAKNHRRTELAQWCDEAIVEALNRTGQNIGVVVHKRKGAGEQRFGYNYVTLTLADLVKLIERVGR